jgi:hypothetical protein
MEKAYFEIRFKQSDSSSDAVSKTLTVAQLVQTFFLYWWNRKCYISVHARRLRRNLPRARRIYPSGTFPYQLTLCSWVPLERPQVVQPLGSSQHFMEPEGSLPRSQEISTCTYPEPDQSSPQHSILSLKGPSKCYLSTYVSVFLVVSFPLAFLPITYTRSSSPPFVQHVPPTSSSSTI